MSNAFDDVRAAVRAAEFTLEAADSAAKNMAELLVGRLRHIKGYGSSSTLRKLKRELRDFDMVTGKWKERSHG